MGLPVSRRLRSSADFAEVRANGVTYQGRYILLNVLTRGDKDSPWLCGLITTKKSGGAVQRNLLRRRLRELVRSAPIKSGQWLVIVVRWRAKDATFAELKEDWRRLTKRAQLLEQSAFKGKSSS